MYCYLKLKRKTMTKLKLTNKALKAAPQKYTRLVITEEKSGAFLVEKGGKKELRLGGGKWSEVTPRKFISLLRSAVQTAKQNQVKYLAIEFNNSSFPKLEVYGGDWVVSTIAENLLLADYEFTKYKTGKENKKTLKEILVCDITAKKKAAWNRGVTLAECANAARDIANTTGDDLTPSGLARAAKEMAKGTKINVNVLDEKAIKKEGLHALWAVGKGADDMPRFIIMEYWPLGKPDTKSKDKRKQPIVLVGKGITYDTGGLNIKPAPGGGMHEMHMDMSGGASVIAAIICAAKLGIQKNIVALIPTAENAVSEKSMRAGDIIKSHSGKTIEVLHTDAEGRLILADGLSYAKKYDPRVVLDVATLTGASLVALGQHASAIMTKDENLQKTLSELGEESGDYVWPLPLWDEYKAPLTQTRADVVNIQPGFSRNAGTIEGAAFLSFFAPKCPWAHIDIAPRMDSIPSDKLAKGSTGEPVRLLVKFLERY